MPRPSPQFVQASGTIKYQGNTTSSYNATTYGHEPYHRTYTGTVTPGFHGKRKQMLPNNAHSVVIRMSAATKLTDKRWSIRISDNLLFSNETWEYTHAWRMDWYVPIYAHLEGARLKAFGKASQQMSKLKFNAAQAFAERGQTANLLASTARRIVEAARALKHGRFNDLYTAVGMPPNLPRAGLKAQHERILRTPIDKRVANHWLEFQYGWKPLLQDAYGAAELLGYHAANDLYHERVEAEAVERKPIKDTFAVGTGAGLVHSKTKILVNYRLDSASRAALAQTGISNPALLAWELLPYSFVIDWFIPIGNYLESLQQFSGFDFVSGWQVQITKQLWDRDFTYFHKIISGGLYDYRQVTGRFTSRGVKFNRSSISSWPTQPFPSFKNPLGGAPVERFATAFSLLRVLFK